MMILSLLVAALPLASSDASAASNTAYSHARLLDSGARVVFVDDEATGDFPPIEGMTREQLQREWDRLDSDRPSLGGAIGLTVAGVAVAAVGFVLAIYGLGFAFISSSSASMGAISPAVGATLLIIGAILIAAGVAVGVVGGLRLKGVLRDRSRYGEQMNRIRDLLDNNPGQPYYPPQPPPGDQNSPPPPPPPPPSVRNLPPAVGGQIALFQW